MNKIKKIISLLLLISISLLPAIKKITNEIPPEWFLKKFDGTILDLLPFGLEFSFIIIIAIEVIAPIIMMFGLIKLIQNKESEKIISLGFIFYYLLFLILTFGSFLIADYDNGFKDFTYFAGLVVIEYFIFNEKRSNNT